MVVSGEMMIVVRQEEKEEEEEEELEGCECKDSNRRIRKKRKR